MAKYLDEDRPEPVYNFQFTKSEVEALQNTIADLSDQARKVMLMYVIDEDIADLKPGVRKHLASIYQVLTDAVPYDSIDYDWFDYANDVGAGVSAQTWQEIHEGLDND